MEAAQTVQTQVLKQMKVELHRQSLDLNISLEHK